MDHRGIEPRPLRCKRSVLPLSLAALFRWVEYTSLSSSKYRRDLNSRPPTSSRCSSQTELLYCFPSRDPSRMLSILYRVLQMLSSLVRLEGIEPPSPARQAGALPLSYSRFYKIGPTPWYRARLPAASTQCFHLISLSGLVDAFGTAPKSKEFPAWGLISLSKLFRAQVISQSTDYIQYLSQAAYLNFPKHTYQKYLPQREKQDSWLIGFLGFSAVRRHK